MGKILTRMGDGYPVFMSEEEIKADLEKGADDVAKKRGIARLTEEDLERLLEICTVPSKLVSVERGNEIILTGDGTAADMAALAPIGVTASVQLWERAIGVDTAELRAGLENYSYKTVKPAFVCEEAQRDAEETLHTTVIPFFFGSMPDLGLYSQPDGPIPNPMELLPQGRIEEAKRCQEEAIEYAVNDMVFVGTRMYESGVDGIDFDTTGAAGDADFLAALKATEILTTKFPNLCVIIGMATENVLGMHGELYYDGVRLAGLLPHEQVKVAQKAGAKIFGPAITTNTGRSFAWNLARAVTFTKTCVEASSIPVHTNVGMGVGGLPMREMPTSDTVARAATALTEVGKLDGL